MLEEAHPEIPFDWPGLLKSLLGAVNTPRPATAPAPPFRPRRNSAPGPVGTSPHTNGHRPSSRGTPPPPAPVHSSRGNGSWTSSSRQSTVPEPPPESTGPWIEVQEIEETIVEQHHVDLSPVDATWQNTSSLTEDTASEEVKGEDSDDGEDDDVVSSNAHASDSESAASAGERQRRRRRRRRGGRGREGVTVGRAAGDGGPSTDGPSGSGSDSD